MKKLFLFAVLFVAAAFSSCEHDDVETPVVPDSPDLPDKEPLELAIAFADRTLFIGKCGGIRY